MRQLLCLVGCALLLAACADLIGARVAPPAEPVAAVAATPTALPGEIVDAADAENRLLTNIYARSSASVVNIEASSLDETRRGSGFVLRSARAYHHQCAFGERCRLHCRHAAERLSPAGPPGGLG